MGRPSKATAHQEKALKWAKKIGRGEMPDPRAKNAKSKDPGAVFVNTLDEELRFIFAELASRVSYLEFADKLTASEFRTMTEIIFFEDFWGVDPERVRKALRLQEEDYKKLKRKHLFSKLRGRFNEEMEHLQKAEKFTDLLEDEKLQTRMLMALKQLALHAGDSRVRAKALDTLAERMAPRLVKRTDEGLGAQTVIMIQGKVASDFAQFAIDSGLEPPKLIADGRDQDSSVLTEAVEGDS